MVPYIREAPAKPKDTLKRRNRYYDPQPRDRSITITPRDLDLFEAIHRHGPLPPSIAFSFTGRKDYNDFQHRLTQLYNGCCAKFDEHVFNSKGKDVTDEENPKHRHIVFDNYLLRPSEYRSPETRYDSLVYTLNANAEQLLYEHNRLSPYIQRTDHAFHRFMTACIGASIEIMSLKKKIPYISRHEILKVNDNRMRLPLSHRDSLEPDELFGLHIPGKKLYFMVEIDRGTEQNKLTKNRITMEEKFAAYAEVMRDRTYEDVWGTPNMRLIFFTTQPGRLKNMAELLERHSALARKTLFKAYPMFGRFWRVPQTPLTDVLEPFELANGSMFEITKGAP